ncbi:MAG TPA: DNA primase [Candidatus Pacearchaeota archaeon]|nr:DNA primase [Candidatus Pacearchaeota archaeon]HPO68154.1 DNA primase [Candidatus Pacearchaeota archaeon]
MLDSPIDEIKNRLDIVDVVGSYVKLQKTGANYRAPCPFHSDKKPSFFVSPSRQIWHCFGCGKGGDIFAFIREIEGVEFGDALKILAQRAGVELKREDPKIKTERKRLFEICELSCQFFEKQLEKSENGKKAKEYLLKRGLKEETIKKWRLGYAPNNWRSLSDFLVGKGYTREEVLKAGLSLKSEKKENYYDRFRGRIMFPVFNITSQVIGFGGRVFEEVKKNDEGGKYINISNTLLYDKSRTLYGLNMANLEIRRKDFCILVEGYMDAIMVNQSGFENVVAASGTGLTEYQLRILKRYSDNLFTAFDMDVAGDSATKRGIDLAQSLGFNIKVITMPEDLDPADVVLKDIKLWEDLVKNAKTIHDFYFEKVLKDFNRDTIEGKKEIAKTILPIIKNIPNKIEQTLWVKDLSEILNVKEEDVFEELKKIPTSQNFKLEDNKIEEEIDKNIKEPFYVSSKTKKDMLQEYLITLFLKFPQLASYLKEEDLRLFSPQYLQIIKTMTSPQNANYLDKNLENNIKSLIDMLSFRAEVMEIDPGINLEKEFQYCLKEIKVLNIKDKLNEIGFKIKEAEGQNNSSQIQKLMEDFNSYSKIKNDLETS